MKTKFNLTTKFLRIDNIITYNRIVLPALIFLLIYTLMIYTFEIALPSNRTFSLFGYPAILLLYIFFIKYWFGYLNQIKEDWSKSITINYKQIRKGDDIINVDKLLSFHVIPYIEYKNEHVPEYARAVYNPIIEYSYVLFATAYNTNKTILITRGNYINCSKTFKKIMYKLNTHIKSDKISKTVDQINENSTLLGFKVILKNSIRFLKFILGYLLLQLFRAL